MGKIFIGDIFEIRTSLGLSYAQYTHTHPIYTDVLRIFKPKFAIRPSDVASLANGEVEFAILCAVSAGFRTGTLPRVGNCPVRENLQPFPKFRNSNRCPQYPDIDDWWIWDDETEARIGKLSPEQMLYPRMGILNLVAIKDLIEGKTHPAFL